MDGFARRKEQSKEDIRMAAWELFSQFGVDKVSMTDVARKAGVSQATIYNNFGSKEALARVWCRCGAGVDMGEVRFWDRPEAEEDNTYLELSLVQSFNKSAGSAAAGTVAAVAFNVFVLLYVPCMVAVAAMRQEFGGRWMWMQEG